MLILTRKPGESLYIGDNIKITIVELKGHQIRVGITAPPELRIYREEIYLQILEENKAAAAAPQAGSLDNLSAVWSETKGPVAAGGGGDKGGGEEKPRRPVAPAGFSAAPLTGNQAPGAPRVAGLSSFATSRSKEQSNPDVIMKRKRGKKPDNE